MRYFTILLSLLCSTSLFAQLGEVQAPFDFSTQYQAIEVANNGTGWAAGTCGTLVKTTDFGESWLEVTSPGNLDFEAIACAPGTNCQEVFLAAENFILHTTNGGNSWTTTEIESRDPDEFFFYNNDLVLHLTDEDKIWRSTNSGSSWTSLEIPNFPQADWTQIGQDLLTSFEHEGGAALVRSSDQGISWDTLYEHPSGGFQRMAWQDAQNGVFYTNAGRSYNTTDGGQNWTMGTDDDPFSTPRGFLSLGNDIYHAYVFPHTLWTTTDAGATWISQGQYKDFGQHKGVYRNGNNIWVANSQSAIFKSSNAGVDFELKTPAPRPRLINIDFQNDDVGYAIGTSSSIMRTTDGGDNWEQLQPDILNSTFFTGYDVHVRDNGDVIATWAQADPMISTNGGDTWSYIIPSQIADDAQASLVFYAELGTGRQYYAGGNASIYTDNGGQDWTTVQQGFNFFPRFLYFYDDNLGFLGGSGATILKTTNGGESWEELPSPFTSGDINEVIAFSPMHILASRGTTAAFSMDGGQTWTVDNDFPTGYDLALNTDGILFAGGFSSGNNGDAFRSLDQGETWQQFGYVCHAIRSATLTPSGNYFFMAGDGGIIVRYDTDLVSGTDDQPNSIATQRLLAFPNPTHGLLTIDLSEKDDYTPLDISVFDLSGRLILQRKETVSQQLNLDLSQEAAGVYLIRLAGEGWFQTGRVIKQ